TNPSIHGAAAEPPAAEARSFSPQIDARFLGHFPVSRPYVPPTVSSGGAKLDRRSHYGIARNPTRTRCPHRSAAPRKAETLFTKMCGLRSAGAGRLVSAHDRTFCMTCECNPVQHR